MRGGDEEGKEIWEEEKEEGEVDKEEKWVDRRITGDERG